MYQLSAGMPTLLEACTSSIWRYWRWSWGGPTNPEACQYIPDALDQGLVATGMEGRQREAKSQSDVERGGGRTGERGGEESCKSVCGPRASHARYPLAPLLPERERDRETERPRERDARERESVCERERGRTTLRAGWALSCGMNRIHPPRRQVSWPVGSGGL